MDAGFKTAVYPSLTMRDLRHGIASATIDYEKASAEIARRVAVDAGDARQATDGDKLHGRVGRRIYEENGGAL